MKRIEKKTVYMVGEKAFPTKAKAIDCVEATLNLFVRRHLQDKLGLLFCTGVTECIIEHKRELLEMLDVLLDAEYSDCEGD